MSDNALALRPHHGMCLAYFTGAGYSGGFTAHMSAVLAGLSRETPVRLTVGTDIICAACPNNIDGLCEKPELVAAYDRAVLERCGLTDGAALDFGTFAALVQRRILAPGLRREICGGCQWDGICSTQRSRWNNRA